MNLIWEDEYDFDYYCLVVSKFEKVVRRIVKNVVQNGYVFVIIYIGLQIYVDEFLFVEWEYVVFDEGYKI